MSGVGEASLVLGLISSILSIIDATRQVYDAVNDETGLPKNFRQTAARLPLVSSLLEDAEGYVDGTVDVRAKDALAETLKNCKTRAENLHELFEKVLPVEGDSRIDRYAKAARSIGKGGRVETLMAGILGDLQLLTLEFPGVTNARRKENLTRAVQDVQNMEPSLDDGFQKSPMNVNSGSGTQNNNTGTGAQYVNTGNQMNGSGPVYIGTLRQQSE